MSELAPELAVVLLEKVRLHADINDVLAEYRQRVANEQAPANSVRLQDYKRWSVVYEKLLPYETFLDIGIGMGQLVNAAARSGHFKKVMGVDRKPHSGLQICSDFVNGTLDLTAAPNPQFRADVVTCLEVIEHLSNSGLRLAI